MTARNGTDKGGNATTLRASCQHFPFSFFFLFKKMITTTTPALEVWNGTGRRIKKETKKRETNLPAAVTMTPRCLRVAVHVFFLCVLWFTLYTVM